MPATLGRFALYILAMAALFGVGYFTGRSDGVDSEVARQSAAQDAALARARDVAAIEQQQAILAAWQQGVADAKARTVRTDVARVRLDCRPLADADRLRIAAAIDHANARAAAAGGVPRAVPAAAAGDRPD